MRFSQKGQNKHGLIKYNKFARRFGVKNPKQQSCEAFALFLRNWKKHDSIVTFEIFLFGAPRVHKIFSQQDSIFA